MAIIFYKVDHRHRRIEYVHVVECVRSQVLRDMRACQFCKTDIGDEFHYLLRCVNFKKERKKYIEAKYYI